MLSCYLPLSLYNSLGRLHYSSNERKALLLATPKKLVSVLYGTYSGTSKREAESFYNALLSALGHSSRSFHVQMESSFASCDTVVQLNDYTLILAPLSTFDCLLFPFLSNASSSLTHDVKKTGGSLATTVHDGYSTTVEGHGGQSPNQLEAEHTAIIFLSTYTEGAPPPMAMLFYNDLRDQVNDFRVDRNILTSVSYAVAAFGSLEYHSEEPHQNQQPSAQKQKQVENSVGCLNRYCTAGKEVDQWLHRLGATRLVPLIRCTDTLDTNSQLREWRSKITDIVVFRQNTSANSLNSLLPASVSVSGTLANAPLSELYPSATTATVCETSSSSDSETTDELDLEDTLSPPKESQKESDSPKEMLTAKQRRNLEKEGYKLLGSHSAVKMCRWTKAQLRGRGGCYKHTFYGIASYQCMELTPSLACANKCVFCWRHHKNPVGTSWKWIMDEPQSIVEEGISKHVQMIKELKGMPGVIPSRFLEAQTVRHCALSLVGEPIMYPQINRLVDLLHSRGISTFLVTNGQFPEAIRLLHPITQLYVSIDAADKPALQVVDRPLFSDFWERLMASIDALREKKQRTVYRLTLVKQYNMQDAQAYAQLMRRGLPDFVEIKAVTYCGKSDASNLTMQNVPWHQEVVRFGKAICNSFQDIQREYDLASEHRHSCCIVLARKRYQNTDGSWNTWIDYDKFDQLIKIGQIFSATDYCCPTPAWAMYGAVQEGFDPQEKRVYTKGKAKRNNNT